jgi:hypothetical protein
MFWRYQIKTIGLRFTSWDELATYPSIWLAIDIRNEVAMVSNAITMNYNKIVGPTWLSKYTAVFADSNEINMCKQHLF